MAQAPEGGASAPRQNKTVKQFTGMNTQNRRNAIPEGAFGWLENIQPIGPGHLHSIPGRSSQITLIPPFNPPVECIPTAPEGIEQMDILFEAGISPAVRFTWSFIADNPGGEIVYEAATNIPFCGSGGCEQLYKSTNGVTTTETYPAGVGGMSNAAPGLTDRPLLAWSSGGAFFLFPPAGPRMDFNISGQGFGANVRNWTVNGNFLFVGGNDLQSGGSFAILKYLVDTQVFIASTLISGQIGVQTVHYNGEFVYVLCNSSATVFTIFKFDTDLNLLDTFELGPGPTPDNNNAYLALFAKSDEQVYVIRRNILGAPGTIASMSYVSFPDQTQTLLDDEIVGDGFASDGAAWVMAVHTDPDTDRDYFYLGRQTSAFIYKYGFVECL